MTPTEPATAAPKKLMTVDEYWEFCQRPENADRRTELIHGEVQEVSLPTHLHGVVVTRIGGRLDRWLEETGHVGYVASNSGVVLEERPGTVVGPDVAYYAATDNDGDIPPKWGDIPPVLAVEVLSPNDKMSKVNAKISDYLNSGVKLVWLVDYEDEVVTVYRPGHSHGLVKADGLLSGGDDLPGFSCKVGDLFRSSGKKTTVAPPAPPTA